MRQIVAESIPARAALQRFSFIQPAKFIRISSSDARCFNVQLDASWVQAVQQHSSIMTTSLELRGGRSAYLARRLYDEFRRRDKFSSLAIQGLTLEILADLSRHAAGRSGPRILLWLERARDIIDERFRERLSLVQIAEAVEVHPVHLAREFHRAYRCTFGDYVRERRIASVCHELASSDLPLCDIALAAGFFDQSHFARTFKRYTGMTPKRYRAARRAR